MTMPPQNRGSQPPGGESSGPSLRLIVGLIFLAGALAKVAGVVREIMVARYFGTSAALDAVYLGLSIPLAVTVGLGGGFVRATVSTASGLDDSRFAGLAREGIKRVRTLSYALTAILAASALIWVPLLAIGQTLSSAMIIAISALAGCCLVLWVGAAGLHLGLANARGRHAGISMMPLYYNLAICLAILLAANAIGALALVAGIVLAEGVQLLIAKYSSSSLLKARPKFKQEDWTTLQSRLAPAAVAGILIGLNTVVDRLFAAQLDEGSIAALAYADKLVNLPVGLLGTAIAIPLHTRLSEHRNRQDEVQYRRMLLKGVRLLLWLGLPLAAYITWGSQPLIGLVLQGGAFDINAVDRASLALSGYAVGIPFLTLSLLLINATTTSKNPWALAWILLGSTVLNALLNALLIGPFGIVGIALSTSIVAVIRTFLLIGLASRYLLFSKAFRKMLFEWFLLGTPVVVVLLLLSTMPGWLSSEGNLDRLWVLLAGGIVASLAATPMLLKVWKEFGGGGWELSTLRNRK